MVSDRKGIAFYLPETRILLDELPDDFYELSKSEAKMIYHEFTQKRKELDDKPMLTASMRELEQSKKMREFLERYKYCIVRVQFADRSVLQGIFQPNEPFQEVINFVKAHLREDLDDFFLFTTPPKVIPNAEKTLLELKFVPGVKLYFGTANTQISTFLKEDILINIRSPEIAAREAHRYRMTKVVNEDAGKEKKNQENGTDVATDEFCNCTDGSTSKKNEQPSSGSKTDETLPGPSNQSKPRSSSSSNQNKVPKWFQPNKK